MAGPLTPSWASHDCEARDDHEPEAGRLTVRLLGEDALDGLAARHADPKVVPDLSGNRPGTQNRRR
jgi:hypothetical protein